MVADRVIQSPQWPGKPLGFRAGLAVLTLLVWALVALAASDLDEQRLSDLRDQPWRFSNLTRDGDLNRLNLFFLDFAKDGTAWIATSDGLVRYDGYRWERFSVEHGLPSPVIRALLVTRAGALWVGTDKGAGVFDGKTFHSMGSEKGLGGPCVRRIVEDPDGTLWFCCDQWPDARVPGGLSSLSNGVWKTYREADGLPGDCVQDYLRDAQGHQWTVVSGKGVALKEGERWQPIDLAGLMPWAMAESPLTGIVTYDDKKVVVIHEGRTDQYPLIAAEGSRFSSRVPYELCTTRDGAILAASFEPGTNRLAIFQFIANGWVPVSAFMPLRPTGIECVREAPDGAIWCAGTGLLLRWDRQGGEWTEYASLPPPRLRDPQGRIWFADLQRAGWLQQGRFTSEPRLRHPLTLDGHGDVWSRGDELARHQTSGERSVFGPQHTGLQTVAGDGVDGWGRYWIVGRDLAGSNAVAVFDGTRWQTTPIPAEPGYRITRACAESQSGAIWVLLQSSDTAAPLRIVRVEEGVTRTLTLNYWGFGEAGLRVDSGGSLWVHGLNGLYQCADTAHPDWRRVNDIPSKWVVATQVRGDETWFVYENTSGGENGLAVLFHGRWTSFRSEVQSGSGFISLAPDQTLFVGSAHELLMVPSGQREPLALTVPGGGEVTSAVKGEQGALWLGIRNPFNDHESVLFYQPDGMLPETEAVALTHEVRTGGALKVKLVGVGRFVPRDTPRTFRFSWRLDDRAWSPFQSAPENGISVAGLRSGLHRLSVRAQDEGLDVDAVPAELAFTVLPVPLQEHGWFRPIVAGVFVVILSLALVWLDRARKLARANASLGQEIGVRREAEQALQATHLELQAAHQGLGRAHDELERRVEERTRQLHTEISARLQAETQVAAVTSERTRLARELHDTLEQGLAGVGLQLEAAAKSFEANPDKARQQVDTARHLIRHSQEEVRRSVWNLRASALENQFLPAALELIARQLTANSTVQAEVRVRGAARRLPEDIENELLRIGQEALTNALKYAQATRIVLELEFQAEHVVLRVADNGQGFDPSQAGQPQTGHFGLCGMGERVKRLDGRLAVRSVPGQGTTLEVTVPLTRPVPGNE